MASKAAVSRMLPHSCSRKCFEEAVGFLVQRCDKTSVQEMFNIAWRTVGQIVERVVRRHRHGDPLDGLTAIGVDELSYRKGYKHVTTVTNQLTGQIVWAQEGKNAQTLRSFFEELGEERRSLLEVVTMDMSEAYISTVKELAPRRRSSSTASTCRSWSALRWPLLKNPWNLTSVQSRRLSTLQKDNDRLYRAYLLKESFADILNRRQPNIVKSKLEDWMGPRVRLAK